MRARAIPGSRRGRIIWWANWRNARRHRPPRVTTPVTCRRFRSPILTIWSMKPKTATLACPGIRLHKVMAGLLDTCQHTGNNQALTVLTNLANWAQFRLDQLTASQIQSMLNYREYGGMNEVLANLYAVTSNTNYLRIAADFDKQSLFTPLSQDQDVLDGLHANTQIPEIIGAAREYELTGTASYHEIAGFFWNRVANYRSYVIGGRQRRRTLLSRSRIFPPTWTAADLRNLQYLQHAQADPAPVRVVAVPPPRWISTNGRCTTRFLGSQEPVEGMMTYFVSLEAGPFQNVFHPEQFLLVLRRHRRGKPFQVWRHDLFSRHQFALPQPVHRLPVELAGQRFDRDAEHHFSAKRHDHADLPMHQWAAVDA